MNAIILTAEQADQIETINHGIQANRVLKPRTLQDGRLILNADVLDDPFFADGPWGVVLSGALRAEVTEKELGREG